jgi:thermostable 8-oxoguanine DNA glycosylase
MDYLINPRDVINFHRSTIELELFWLFCICVAGKTAQTQARLLNDFLMKLHGNAPFEKIKQLSDDELLNSVKMSGLGQYNRISRAFRESTNLDLQTANINDLEAIYGVGPKTARMFLMMTRPDQQYAALDTHVLKYLGSRGVDVPKATPSGSKYQVLEAKFLEFAKESKMPVAEFDLMIWKRYSRDNVSSVNT